MEFLEHFSISLVFGLFISLMYLEGLSASVFVVFISLFFGSFIDFDHFIIARYRYGNWNKLFLALKNPLDILYQNEALIGEKWLSPPFRFSVHIFEIILLLLVYSSFSSIFIAVALVSLSIHIFCDLIADWRKGYIRSDYLG